MTADFSAQHRRHDPARGPLSRFTILDASRVRAGPTAMRVFADMGARVIKLEIPPGAPGGDDMIGGRDHNRADYENLHRNKESLTLNMKAPEGRAILHELVRRADVFIENFRPDVKERLGIGPDALRALNPRLVYASISGFGQDGPYARWPGFDSIAQGMGGLMSVTGKPGEGPMRVGIPLADLCAGHFCAQAILTALLEREASGEGQWVRTSLLEAQIAMLDFQAAQWLIERELPQQVGNEHPLTVPTGVFETQDSYLNLAAIGNAMWARLCDALGLAHLARAPGYASDPARVQNRAVINQTIGEVFKTRTTKDWTERLLAAGVPCGPIYTIDEMFDDAQVKHLGIAWPVKLPGKAGRNADEDGGKEGDEDGGKEGDEGRNNGQNNGEAALVGPPFSLSRYPRAGSPRVAPEQGEHTQAILRELGYSDAQIQQWRAAFVV